MKHIPDILTAVLSLTAVHRPMKTTVILAVAAGICATLAAAAPAPALDARVVVQADRPGAPIPADFMGLSYEPPVIAAEHFDAANRVFIQLLRNLGGGVLRFGGNHVEETFWSRRAGESFPKAKAVLGPADLDRLFGFSRAAGWPVILGGRAIAADGSWSPDTAEDVAVAGERCEVSLPAAGAAVLEFE
jgi:hypothetical protein